MQDQAIEKALARHWEYEGRDFKMSHEIYHDDAVLEFPQSGERFVGKDNFLTWREQYPAKLDFRIRRIVGRQDLWVAENLISYDGSPWSYTVNIMEFRGERIAYERLYVTDAFEAPEWRAEWAERFNPEGSVEPSAWDTGK